MKRQPGKDMIVFGSGSIVSQLTKHGLIDEYQVAVCPIFLGTGKPMLTGVSKHVRLDLLDAKVSPLGGCNASLCAPELDCRWGAEAMEIDLHETDRASASASFLKVKGNPRICSNAIPSPEHYVEIFLCKHQQLRRAGRSCPALSF